MFEQFGNYPEIKWTACAAAQAYSHLDKLEINPDLDNFKIERFKDLRNQPKVNKDLYFKLMLIGSRTNIFIDGPEELLNEIVKRLPKYIGKSWIEIKNMSLERDFLNCINAETSVCNPKLFDIIELKPIKPREEIPELNLNRVDEICSECKHFEPK